MKVLVDIIVVGNNGQFQALRPVYDSHNPMPLTEPEKSNWLKTIDPDRLNKRIIATIVRFRLVVVFVLFTCYQLLEYHLYI